MVLLALVFLLQTTPIPGMWQKVDQLSLGTPLRVELKSGQVIDGTFVGSTAEVLQIKDGAATEMTLAKSDVSGVVQPGARDRLRNGTLIGAATGFAAGFLTLLAYDRALTESGYRFDAENASIYVSGGLIGAGIGALTGALIDLGIKGDLVLFKAR